MRFLKTLFWVLIVAAIALFSMRNWTPVTVNLWGGLVLDTALPVLVIIAFLTGLIPTFLLHRATRWNLRRKLDSLERSLNEFRAPAPISSPISAPATTPSGVA